VPDTFARSRAIALANELELKLVEGCRSVVSVAKNDEEQTMQRLDRSVGDHLDFCSNHLEIYPHAKRFLRGSLVA
jgi:hypothetical protein